MSNETISKMYPSMPERDCLAHLLTFRYFAQVFGGRSWSLTGMLKDRGHKGSWKGTANPSRAKKKSYGNIHSINDRGIAEIYESFGTNPASSLVTSSVGGGSDGMTGASVGNSAPTSPWASPKLGRKSTITTSPTIDRASSRLLPIQQ